MPKQTLGAANFSAQNRHGLSATNAALFTGRAQMLANVASLLHANDNRNSQSVTAIGYDSAYPTVVLVSRNGQLTDNQANPLSNRLDKAVYGRGLDWGDILVGDIFEWQVICVNTFFGETEGWHAEMMIVRFLMTHAQRNKSTFGSLSIGASTVCCPDCSGWMTRYGIAHAPFGTPGDTASAPWRNPTTGSTFAYTKGQVSYYLSPRSKESLGSV